MALIRQIPPQKATPIAFLLSLTCRAGSPPRLSSGVVQVVRSIAELGSWRSQEKSALWTTTLLWSTGGLASWKISYPSLTSKTQNIIARFVMKPPADKQLPNTHNMPTYPCWSESEPSATTLSCLAIHLRFHHRTASRWSHLSRSYIE